MYKDKILDISRKLSLSHIGSNLSVLPILEKIYAKKKPKDKVILDNAHAHLAHLAVQGLAVELIEKDIHCNRQAGCDALGGSLGHGIGISIGYALANPKIKVYCIVSDGSMHEGSNMEALRLLNELNIKNVELHLNYNGYSALAPISEKLINSILAFWPIKIHRTNNGKGFDGVQGHYKTI